MLDIEILRSETFGDENLRPVWFGTPVRVAFVGSFMWITVT